MKKICAVCGLEYDKKLTFVKISKDFYLCEFCFRKEFGPVYEHDEEIDKVWEEVKKKKKKKKDNKKDFEK